MSLRLPGDAQQRGDIETPTSPPFDHNITYE